MVSPLDELKRKIQTPHFSLTQYLPGCQVKTFKPMVFKDSKNLQGYSSDNGQLVIKIFNLLANVSATFYQ